MYEDGADYYDLIHRARGRNPALEATLVAIEARRRAPDATTLLDVGCGTGIHLPTFAESFEVSGIDRSTAMLAAATRRLPHARLVVADMRDFELGRRFDVIVSLDSGIGYLSGSEDVETAVATMSRHLEPGGVLMIEGWYESPYWSAPSVTVDSGADEHVAVARFTRGRRHGEVTELDIRYEIATMAGHRTIEEKHVIRLTDPAEMSRAFARAGLGFERLPHMLRPGRSVYVGLRQSSS